MKGTKLPVLPPEGFVRIPVVLQVLGIGRTALYTGIKEGKYPEPVRIGPRTSPWRVEDIREFIAKYSKKSLAAQGKNKPLPKKVGKRIIAISGELEITMDWVTQDCPKSRKNKYDDDRA